MYMFIDEPKDEKEMHMLVQKAFALRELLSKKEQEQINKEFDEYRDTSHKEGKPFKPWYIWMIDKVEVKLR